MYTALESKFELTQRDARECERTSRFLPSCISTTDAGLCQLSHPPPSEVVDMRGTSQITMCVNTDDQTARGNGERAS